MKKLEITGIGTKGLNTDLAPWELPPEYITFGSNFRVTGQSLESTNAFDVWTTPPSAFNAGHVLSVEVASGDFWIVPGRTAVWVYNGVNWFDISAVEGYAGMGVDDELNWTHTLLGSIPIINNPQSYPEYWSPQSTGQIMQRLQFDAANTWEDVSKSFKVIRSHGNFLFALGLIEGGTSLPNGYRWSHPADTNGLPFTWDPADPSSIASQEQILGDAGAIVDGRSLRNSFVIYSERGINILDQVGGEFVFQNRELSTTHGLLNKNSLVEARSVHYFLSDGDILRNDGNTVTSIVHDRIRETINNNLNSEFYFRSYAVLDVAKDEVWFCLPETGFKYPNVAYVYNYVEDAWSIKHLPPNAAFAAYGSVTSIVNTWDANTDTWASTQSTWGNAQATPLNRSVVSVDALTSELVIVNARAGSSLLNIESRIERTDFPLGGMDRVTTLTRMYPAMEGTADVSIQVGSQQYPGGPVAWKAAQTFNPSTDRKLDVRTTGELHAWRIDSIGTGHWSLSGITFEYEDAGAR